MKRPIYSIILGVPNRGDVAGMVQHDKQPSEPQPEALSSLHLSCGVVGD